MKKIYRLRILPLLLALFSLVFCLGLGMPLRAAINPAPIPGTVPALTQPAKALPLKDLQVADASPTPEPSTDNSTDSSTDSGDPPDRLEVYMTVLSVDPVKGEVDARLEFLPYGKFQSGKTLLTAKNISLITNNVDPQGSVFAFRANRRMDAKLIRFSFIKGNANNYPFDNYESQVDIYGESYLGKTELDNYSGVPFVFYPSANIPGFDINFSSIDEKGDPELIYEAINIQRSATVKFFSLMVMGIMWILAILVLLLAIRVWRSGKLPEVTMLGLMATLLFAFPAIRNTQPNVPPVGTMGDYLSFLWTELIVVIALVIIGGCWLRRYHPAEKENKEG
jgi:hypothetical protein